jgi:CRP/FNR family cyclic AMP-dependent transcriptional regulator
MLIQSDVLQQITKLITAADWFQGLPEEAINRLVNAAKLATFSSNKPLYLMGTQANNVFGILSGKVEISISSYNGEEFAICDEGAGYWLGEFTLANDSPRILNVVAQEETQAVVIPKSVLNAIGDEFPLIYRNLFKLQIHRISRLYRLFGHMVFYPLESRLALIALSLVESHGVSQNNHILIKTELSQAELGKRTLSSRQSVNQILRRWSVEDIFVKSPTGYIIKDLDALKLKLSSPIDSKLIPGV